MTDHRKIADRVWERSQRPTPAKIRVGRYRIVNGVVIEDGGDIIDHRVIVDVDETSPPKVSGTRKKAKP